MSTGKCCATSEKIMNFVYWTILFTEKSVEVKIIVDAFCELSLLKKENELNQSGCELWMASSFSLFDLVIRKYSLEFALIRSGLSTFILIKMSKLTQK